MKFKKMPSLFAMAFLLCLSLVVSASGIGTDATSYSDFYDSAEFHEIQETVLNNQFLSENGILNGPQMRNSDGNQLDTSYKMFRLKQMDFVAELQAGTKLSDLISNDYVWVVSTSSNAIIRVAEIDGKWDVLGYSASESENTVTDLVQMQSLNAELATLSTNQSAITSLLCFEAPMYHTNFVYVEIGDNEFLIPYGSRPDLTNLENGALYTPQEVGDILSNSFDGVYSADANAGGGSLRFNENGNSDVSVLVGSVALIAIIGVTIIFLKKLLEFLERKRQF